MTDFTSYKPTINTKDYVSQINDLCDALDAEFKTADFTNSSGLIELHSNSEVKKLVLRNTTNGYTMRMNTGATQLSLKETDASGTEGNTLMRQTRSGALDLYHNGSNVLSTLSNGIQANGAAVNIINSGANNVSFMGYNTVGGATFRAASSGNLIIGQTDNGGIDEENWVKGIRNGAVSLYHNGTEKIATTSSGVLVDGNVSTEGFFNVAQGADLEIDGSDEITIVTGFHRIDSNGQSGDDTLETINDSTGTGSFLVLKSVAAGRDITFGTSGNIKAPAGFVLDNSLDMVLLFKFSGNWFVLGSANNGT